MKRGIAILIGILVIIGVFAYTQYSGNIVDEFGQGNVGPSEEKMQCMLSCVSIGCEDGDQACMTANSGACGLECGVETEPPTPANEGEACMQECVVVGCEGIDFSCQQLNKESCEETCNMKGDAPDESEIDEEQKCISECVAAEDPSVICGNSQEGETGNALCQRCANECVHLYEGPCLMEEELEEKEEACITCEHCYGEPITGPSGQGWDCIINVECKDASREFGDDPGEGPGIIENIGEGIGNVAEGIVNFFKGIFGGGESEDQGNDGEPPGIEPTE